MADQGSCTEESKRSATQFSQSAHGALKQLLEVVREQRITPQIQYCHGPEFRVLGARSTRRLRAAGRNPVCRRDRRAWELAHA